MKSTSCNIVKVCVQRRCKKKEWKIQPLATTFLFYYYDLSCIFDPLPFYYYYLPQFLRWYDYFVRSNDFFTLLCSFLNVKRQKHRNNVDKFLKKSTHFLKLEWNHTLSHIISDDKIIFNNRFRLFNMQLLKWYSFFCSMIFINTSLLQIQKHTKWSGKDGEMRCSYLMHTSVN